MLWFSRGKRHWLVVYVEFVWRNNKAREGGEVVTLTVLMYIAEQRSWLKFQRKTLTNDAVYNLTILWVLLTTQPLVFHNSSLLLQNMHCKMLTCMLTTSTHVELTGRCTSMTLSSPVTASCGTKMSAPWDNITSLQKKIRMKSLVTYSMTGWGVLDFKAQVDS